MSIDPFSKVDILWKRLFGVSETSPNKSEYEELTLTGEQLRASEIWKEDHLIPLAAGPSEGVVEYKNIRAIQDLSVPEATAWIAIDVFNNGLSEANRIKDWIGPRFSPSYEIKVFADAALTQRIYNSASQTNWVFDYSAGILWFPNPNALSPLTEVYITGFTYIGEKGLNPTFSGDVIDTLGDLSDGNFVGGYVPGFVQNVTKISDAIDRINRALNDFIPEPPANLDTIILDMPGAVSTINDANVVLSDGAIDNSGNIPNKPISGNIVSKVTGNNLETDETAPFGNGLSGTLTLFLNDDSAGSVDLSIGDDSGVYGNLYVEQDTSFGTATASFYEVMRVKAVNLTFPVGMNSLNLNHSVTGTSNTLYLVRDSVSLKPTVGAITINEHPTIINLVNSSGIPHYADNSRLYFGATASNLATDLYLDTKVVQFQTVPKSLGPTVWAYPGAYGLPEVLTKGADYSVSQVMANVTDLANNVNHGSVQVQATARNANGTNSFVDSKFINYKIGTNPSFMSPVDELGIPVNNLGTLVLNADIMGRRVDLGPGQTPDFDITTIAPAVWDSSVPLHLYEAAIVGGNIVQTKQNYGNGNYFPHGPDYTGKDDIQYATFAIQRRNVSQMLIEIEGKYSGMWIKLPGIDVQPLAVNGWMDCFAAYEGWGVPGREVTAGCAVGKPAFGGKQVVHATFGYESSSNSTVNQIFVRIKLVAGDSVSGLRFSGVER